MEIFWYFKKNASDGVEASHNARILDPLPAFEVDVNALNIAGDMVCMHEYNMIILDGQEHSRQVKMCKVSVWRTILYKQGASFT